MVRPRVQRWRGSSRGGRRVGTNIARSGRSGESADNSGPSTPRNRDELSSNSSENGFQGESLPARELPDNLIDFVTQLHTDPEPPQKRRKLAPEHSSPLPDLPFIVVKESVWEVGCSSSKLSEHQLPVGRNNIQPPYIHWSSPLNPEYLEIVSDAKQTLFHVPLPPKNGLEDVYIALLVHRYSKKSGRSEGRLWTEFGLSVLQKDGLDVLRMTFTVKWNVTSSPYHIPQAAKKTKALSCVLDAYFPDTSVKLEKWSPQDFYQSVHTPNKDDETAASLEVGNLKADLYPFQKRAVQWLLRREGVEWSQNGYIAPSSSHSESSLPVSFHLAKDARGQPCFVSHLFGIVALNTDSFGPAGLQLRGGILAEEMGLGKTVEIISLIELHKRVEDVNKAQVYDIFTGQNVRPTGATLIIAPPSILPQWISEVNRHAPHLKVFHYEGIKSHEDSSPAELLDSLAASDVVISTYSVLAAEIHFTSLNPEKILRRESKYPRPKSPLMILSWWRCVMDEAQMIESGVSNAAVVARLIPRINAWCVTGTPVRKDVNDILGLLVFLRYEPYASIKYVWSSLISAHKQDFHKLFGTLALRHSKRSVRDELKLPAQRRFVVTMPFTPVEEQAYQDLFTEMCSELGLDAQGAPLLETWDPESVTEAMRNWLVRLRQAILHPQVGGKNRRALSHKDGPLRTIDQVLDVMMEQTEMSIRADQRAHLLAKLTRGQLFENSPRVKEALAIWQEVMDESSVIVNQCRDLLQQELMGNAEEKSGAKDNKFGSASNKDSEDEQEEPDSSSKVGTFRNRLRAALEVQHVAIFFRANAYFQIKSNEDMTPPESPEFQALEKLEANAYEEAKKLRQEILQEICRKADKLMRRISKKAATQGYTDIPAFPTNLPRGGIESHRIVERLDELAAALDTQANQLDLWREQTIQFLLRPLVDEDEGVEINGDEYEESTKTQDQIMVFVDVLRAAIADRHDALTGQENDLIKRDVKAALHFAKENKGPLPEKIIELLSLRQSIKPDKAMGSVRGFVAELRALETSLKSDADNGSSRAQNELSLVTAQFNATQKQLSEQMKAKAALEKELELFTSAMNARLEYYRQLQQVSDMVAPYEGPNDERVLAKMLQDEEKLATKVATSKSKRKYLEHLRKESSTPQEQRICVICNDSFEIGALTVCGHQYCKLCMQHWWNAHHNCPICKRELIQADVHEITYKPQELFIHTEDAHGGLQERSPSTGRKSTIYSEISQSKLAEIKNIELDGPSFTTKVDTLARHIIWLRESDPGTKSIIFSQFKDFLGILAQAFQEYRINFSSIDKPNGIEKFKQDPSVECFLLHARAHASGLNLVNANHVFLTEPLLNTALELQAIARVDRIGQHQETSVWLYLVDGTIEESIHQLSVKRRMEHIDRRLSKGKGKNRKVTAEEFLVDNLEEANSEELQRASLTGLLAKGDASGEMVEKKDLWDCLFGVASRKPAPRTLDNYDLRLDQGVGRHLRAEAAEQRRTSQP